jgi:hypothetical protein
MIKISLEYMFKTAFYWLLISEYSKLLDVGECLSHLFEPLLFNLFELGSNLKFCIVINGSRTLRCLLELLFLIGNILSFVLLLLLVIR